MKHPGKIEADRHRNGVGCPTASRAPSVHKSTAVRTRNNDHTARLFFTATTPGIFDNKPIQKIIQRSYRLSAQAWAAAHPYGPPPSREQVRFLQEHFINRTVPQKKPIGGFNPAARQLEPATGADSDDGSLPSASRGPL